MKSKAGLLFLLFVFGCSSSTRVVKKDLPDVARDKQLLVAVVDFSNSTGDIDNDAYIPSIYVNFINELSETHRFRVLERKKLESVLSELRLQMTGLVDSATAKKVGGILGVNAMLYGDLSSVKYSKGKQTLFICWVESQKAEILLNARLVNVGTGEIIATSKASTYAKKRKWVAFWVVKAGKMIDKKSLIEKGVELACKQSARILSKKAY